MNLPSVNWGTGPQRAVFLHGFSGAASSFSHLEPLLGDLLTVKCVELPGHGVVPNATWDETVDALGDLLEGGEVLLGYSQGARLALAVAARFPRRVERLILESGAGGFRRRKERLLRRRSDEVLAHRLVSFGIDAFVDEWERLPLFAGLRTMPPSRQHALRERRKGHTAQGLAGALRTLGQGTQPDLWPVLQGLRVPTLLLTGSNDAKYTEIARRMAAELPLGWRVSFPDVGHAPHLECPEEYASQVRAFMATRSWLSEPQELAP